jgi:hypothetical protein
VRNTHKNIFLTGKAGTGKTTFCTNQKGIAQTNGRRGAHRRGRHQCRGHDHSLVFPVALRPVSARQRTGSFAQRRFSGEKIRLIQSLDLLVIDEISMVRADVLDGIDDVLRRYRDRSGLSAGCNC